MEDGIRKKPISLRDEDYINKRVVFLRSYPLQWGKEEEDYKKEAVSLKNRLTAAIHWNRSINIDCMMMMDKIDSNKLAIDLKLHVLL
ncbi:hypothetical protein Cni_G21145 [Canna indica]|uniref:Uncharacterized protein n=1 Tax=Canna indica TaxID=4628 RepID=A0AAQ3KQ83_9LILI|nr:hypothetical protein Cni_G21145 [Canna indica]